MMASRSPSVQPLYSGAMVPLIGVTTYVADAAWGAWERRAAVLPASYFELVASAGGRPLLLPPLSTAPDGPGTGATEVMGALDGLVLTGGGDVDPAAYGEEAIPAVGGVNPVRDASERALLAAALAVDLPVLAICRGLQVLNVALGGTLHQHLPDVVGTERPSARPAGLRRSARHTQPGEPDRGGVRLDPHRAVFAPPGHQRTRPRAGGHSPR